jgi:hypothetical protein
MIRAQIILLTALVAVAICINAIAKDAKNRPSPGKQPNLGPVERPLRPKYPNPQRGPDWSPTYGPVLPDDISPPMAPRPPRPDRLKYAPPMPNRWNPAPVRPIPVPRPIPKPPTFMPSPTPHFKRW